MRVVIVEDNEDIAHMLQVILRMEIPDIDAIAITDPGWEHLKVEHWADVDVAIVDLMLPDITGEEVLVWLRDNAPHVRRVVLSAVAHFRPEVDQLAHAALSKPVSSGLLIAAINGQVS